MKKQVLLLLLSAIIGLNLFAQVSKDSAFAILKREVLTDKWADKEIFSKSQPIAPFTDFRSDGTTLSPNYKSWFFFVDELPYANWAHPCKYVFIDTSNGKITTLDRKRPPLNMESMDVLHRVRPLKETSPDSLFRIPYRTNARNTSSTSNEYAVIISGGWDSYYNWERYWNDCSAMYKTLVNVYNYDKSKIFVLISDGTDPGADMHLNNGNYVSSPLDLDGDGTNDIQYSATISNISRVFDSLSRVITSSDNVFIFTTDHGDEGSLLCLWNQQTMTASQFAAEVNKLVPANTINICMEQCYSGGFTVACAGNKRVIATACAANEPSYAMSNLVYNEFCYHWISAVTGETPAGTPVDADYNTDGFVSMDEAFYYANTNDQQYETPQYYSNCYCLGESLALNGIFDYTCFDNDLYVRDTVTDNGTVPSTVHYAYNSPDIWTTDLDSVACNPIGGEYCYVCVRVHNKSATISSGRDRLIVNWSKAGLFQPWNIGWVGNTPFAPNVPASGYVTDTIGVVIPPIPAGRDTILYILWLAPDPADYVNLMPFSSNEDWWHFCLAARVHDAIPIVGEYKRLFNMTTFTKSNDNVAWKNISIISDDCNGACISVSNPNATTDQMTAKMDLVEADNGNTPSITNYAEVYITLDAGLLAAINSANISGLTWVNSNTLRWNGGSASIPVTLPANSYYTLQTTIHFLADQIPATNNFDFDMVLRNAAGDSILGGEHYQCIRTNGRYFQAVAHDDMTILWGETASLYATDILETAEYKWYDDQGNEVGDGLTCNVSPQQNTNYTLRVTADADGYRAYSTVTVMVVDGELRMLAPNPADNQVRIGYALSRNISAATLQILNGIGQVVYSQALSGGNGSKVTGEVLCNTSTLAAGSYTVRLVSNRGNIFDSKTLVIR